MGTTVDVLCKQIHAAFDDQQYPGDDHIVPPKTRHDAWRVEVAAKFRRRTWQALSVADIRERCDDLPLMTPEAFRYFLPAFMCRRIQAPLDVNTAGSSVVNLLTPPRGRESTLTWWHERVDSFSSPQILAIASFLEYEDSWERNDWAKMGRVIKKTSIGKALRWWKERAIAVCGK